MTATSENAPFFVDTEVLRLTKNGIWFSDDTEISHEPTRKLFARSLRRDEKGYFLSIGRETKRIEVEDTAFFVIRVEHSSAAVPEIVLSDETTERLDPQTLSYRPGRLTCRVKNGAEEAKFLHSPYFDLLRDLHEDQDAYFLTFGPKRIEILRKKERS